MSYVLCPQFPVPISNIPCVCFRCYCLSCYCFGNTLVYVHYCYHCPCALDPPNVMSFSPFRIHFHPALVDGIALVSVISATIGKSLLPHSVRALSYPGGTEVALCGQHFNLEPFMQLTCLLIVFQCPLKLRLAVDFLGNINVVIVLVIVVVVPLHEP